MKDMMNAAVENAVEKATQMFEEGMAQYHVLAYLVKAAEAMAGDNSVSSILALDKGGLLRNAASPQLPHDYLAAIDGLRPDAQVGTCAAAAATGCMVFTPDFMADDKWAELRHLPLALGFAGAWSMPIKDSQGKVLGTFGTYYREKREPTQSEINGKELLAAIAAKVLAGKSQGLT